MTQGYNLVKLWFGTFLSFLTKFPASLVRCFQMYVWKFTLVNPLMTPYRCCDSCRPLICLAKLVGSKSQSPNCCKTLTFHLCGLGIINQQPLIEHLSMLSSELCGRSLVTKEGVKKKRIKHKSSFEEDYNLTGTLLRPKKTTHNRQQTAGAKREVWVIRCFQRPEQENTSGHGGRGGHWEVSVRVRIKDRKAWNLFNGMY